jgi:hypothetical protein
MAVSRFPAWPGRLRASDMMENAPNIGRPGAGWDPAKETRWAAERAECWDRLSLSADTVVDLPSRQMRADAIALYEAHHGPVAGGTLRNLVAHRFEQRRKH